jgi:squalene/oxidosqualene cyclase-like protein
LEQENLLSEILQAWSEVYAGAGPSFSHGDAGPGRQRSRPETGLIALQNDQGAWEGEVIWCPMITAQLVIARAIIGRKADREWSAGVVRYFQTARNADGGWGLHPVSASYLYVTTLVYVALRLLGEPADGPNAGPARAWIVKHPEGVTALPSWGKLWLSFAGLYSYDGVNPVPPELFLLPSWSPIRADHLYCHTRYIYLGLAYLYGCRLSADLGEIGRSLRDELYGRPFGEIDFAANRDRIAKSDLYVTPGRLLRAINAALRLAGTVGRHLGIVSGLRRKALHHCLSLIRGEVLATETQCLSPVNGILNLLALHASDPTDPLIDRLLDGLEAWRWQDEDGGIRYAGARSQTWDTALALQALLPTVTPESPVVTSIRAGYAYLSAGQCQVEPVPRNPDRQAVFGGWCFCDGAHNWPVSDCTAEALTAILACHDVEGLICPADRIDPEHLAAAAEFILDRQNADGGFGSYERRRGPCFLERLNPSEMFGRCMTERSYVECTASCIEALAQFARQVPQAAPGRVARALQDGIGFLRRAQGRDGSYPGFWGINFIYATSFVLRACAAVGRPQTDRMVRRALDWLEARQRPDGGWGEHFSGCLDDRYTENPVSLISSTSWALLGLLAFHGSTRRSVARGLDWLGGRLQADGQLPHESVNGVFFGTAMLEYTLYNASFGTWALGRGLERGGHG